MKFLTAMLLVTALSLAHVSAIVVASAAAPAQSEPLTLTQSVDGCLDSDAAKQCAAAFVACHGSGSTMCDCFSTFGPCMVRAGCGVSTMKDLGNMCVTMGCPPSTCDGTSESAEDYGVSMAQTAVEGVDGCLDSDAAKQCAAEFVACHGSSTSMCDCQSTLRVCMVRAGCGESTMKDLGNMCVTMGCPPSMCDGETAEAYGVSMAQTVVEGVDGCLDSDAAKECAAEFVACHGSSTSMCDCQSTLRVCMVRAGCGVSTMKDLGNMCVTMGCPPSTCDGTSESVAQLHFDTGSCLGTVAAANCVNTFVACHGGATPICSCFSGLRGCFKNAGCGVSTMTDMADMCMVYNCGATACGAVTPQLRGAQ